MSRRWHLERLFRFGEIHRSRKDVRIHLDNFWMSYHILIWKLMYPEDPIKKGETIHHVDWNTHNNSPFNLVKITDAEHHAIHEPGCNIRNFIHSDEIKRRHRIMGEGKFIFLRRANSAIDDFRPMRW